MQAENRIPEPGEKIPMSLLEEALKHAVDDRHPASICFTFADHANDQFCDLAKAGFSSLEKAQEAFGDLPVVTGDYSFLADLRDAEGMILETKLVQYEVIEHLTGHPIQSMIEGGRQSAAFKQWLFENVE